ncbi:hypothetical protein [Paenibacillus faecalis]|uniref:hypothetical protein n=1 Tax=Paenibacillus faecalis TaxID=2079532 RepID=UPI000D10914F|nr:hypothetical protein [Paenibacillus faecalis]
MDNRNRHSKIIGHLKKVWKAIVVIAGTFSAIHLFINVLVRFFEFFLIVFTCLVDLMVYFTEHFNTFVNSIFIYQEVSYGYK